MAKARVVVDSGICGLGTTITAWTDKDGAVSLTIESECANIQGLADELKQVDPMTLFTLKAKDSPVFLAAARHPLHQPCPVPVGILKAVEVAAGFALPADAAIRVERVEED